MRARELQHIATALVGALVLLFAVGQWRAVHTENVNWDEFALLFRAAETMRTGTVQASGRPGLTTLMLVPFAERCANAIEAIVGARRLWLVFTLAYLAAVFALVAVTSGRRTDGWQGAMLAVALVALVPVFMRWSLQVRTDQPALMFACWGGVLLLVSDRARWRAAAAGVLFALGYLCSQKAAYPIVLAFVLLAVRLSPAVSVRAIPWRTLLASTALAGAGFLAGLLAYRAVLSLYFAPATTFTLATNFNIFAFYRAVFGYRAYQAMLPTLLPHLLLAGLAVALLLVRGPRLVRHSVPLAGCGAILLLGLAVGWFHAGAFPYFWMTLGLLPAVALGVGWPAITEAIGRRAANGVLVAAGVLLLVSAVPAAAREDTQRVQRAALAFIDRNFDASARGFQAEGALVCRADPDPFPVYFADVVERRLGGPANAPAIEDFINEFRSRPVAFMIAHRLFPFPAPIERFWREHYVLYRDEVLIPGRRVSGQRGEVVELDVIVPGLYRWRPTAGAAARLGYQQVELGGGATVFLDRGVHRFTLTDAVPAGWLTLAVEDEPGPGGPNFYDPLVIHELDPLYPRDTALLQP